jgi:23S rRNA pseudouridine1911/1915/1917 synthase
MELRPVIEPVFEDDYIIIVNKRPNLLVVPSPSRKKSTLIFQVRQYLQDKKQTAFACHRLDRDTSGLVIFAKTKKARDHIMGQFKSKSITKKYLALVQGKFPLSIKIIKGIVKPLGKPPKFAVTKCKVLKQSRDFSVLEIQPKTGRNNQIRIHLLQKGHPIIGERKYTVAKRWRVKFKRICLHSFFLEFRHPVSGDLVRAKCSIPRDIQEFLLKNKISLKGLV